MKCRRYCNVNETSLKKSQIPNISPTNNSVIKSIYIILIITIIIIIIIIIIMMMMMIIIIIIIIIIMDTGLNKFGW